MTGKVSRDNACRNGTDSLITGYASPQMKGLLPQLSERLRAFSLRVTADFS
jgi:hypothetical protein